MDFRKMKINFKSMCRRKNRKIKYFISEKGYLEKSFSNFSRFPFKMKLNFVTG